MNNAKKIGFIASLLICLVGCCRTEEVDKVGVWEVKESKFNFPEGGEVCTYFVYYHLPPSYPTYYMEVKPMATGGFEVRLKSTSEINTSLWDLTIHKADETTESGFTNAGFAMSPNPIWLQANWQSVPCDSSFELSLDYLGKLYMHEAVIPGERTCY